MWYAILFLLIYYALICFVYSALLLYESGLEKMVSHMHLLIYYLTEDEIERRNKCCLALGFAYELLVFR